MGPSTAVDRWLPIAFVGFGALFATLGLKILMDSVRRRRSWLPRRGVVTHSRFSGQGSNLEFLVAYDDDDGRRVEFWNRFTVGSGIDPVGRQIGILVNPNDPSDAVVVNGPGRPTSTGLVFLIFGVLAAAVGVSIH